MVTLERFKNGKTKWPKVLRIRATLRDWQRARKRIPKGHSLGYSLVGAQCAVAQSLIREVNENRSFLVGDFQTTIREGEVKVTYKNTARVRQIIQAFDRGIWMDEQGRTHKGIPPFLKGEDGVVLEFERLL